MSDFIKEEAAVVEYTSPVCSHCRAMQDIWSRLEESYAGRLSFRQIDITKDEEAAERYHVMSVPTFLFIRNGKVRERLTGEVHPLILEQAVNKLLEQ